MVTDHRPVRTIMHLATTYKALKIHSSACTLQNLIHLACSCSADCAHSHRELFNFMKMRTFYKKLPIFIKNYIDHTYKKLKPQISTFIKNSFFGINRDPCNLDWFNIWSSGGTITLFATRLRNMHCHITLNCPIDIISQY